MYPPIYESAYTKVMLGQVQWNRPTLRKRVVYKCCGLCVRTPSRKCCGLAGGVGQLYNVRDNIKVAHYDSFVEARLQSTSCYSKCCLCDCDSYIILVDINNRWPAWCFLCCPPAEGETIHFVHADFQEALVKQINMAREASLRRIHGEGGTFWTPAMDDMDNFYRADAEPTDYYQPYEPEMMPYPIFQNMD
jgi:hypothetical protein